MGNRDQLAKGIFAEETSFATSGAAEFLLPAEIGLTEVRLDGGLLVKDPARLASLPQPWSLAAEHDEVVMEVKMQGDHLNRLAMERALLRRQAQQVVRVEEGSVNPRARSMPLLMVASHVPKLLLYNGSALLLGPGCYSVEPSGFPFLWIAANELPLREELIPFLIARTGRALDQFMLWFARRKPSIQRLSRMVGCLPMSRAAHNDLSQYLLPPGTKLTSDEIKDHLAWVVLQIRPWMGQRLIDEGRQEGLASLWHVYERRLGRALSSEEHRTLRERLRLMGAARLGDVVLDLSPEALGAWLADPDAR